MPFISIQLNSNRPKSIVEFLNNIEETADRPEDIEVLLHIDTGDVAMEEVVAREKARCRLSLRVLQTDLVKGYATLWLPLNPLFQMTHPEAYFVSNLFDEVRFKTKGWDTILRAYKHYYPDDIFRLRASQYRFRNYTDFWECGYAPDSLAFYTRRWMALGGDWNPCLGPDSFQQLVAFYLMTDNTASPRQFNRDITLPDVYFAGEGAGDGLEGVARNRWLCINNRAWYVLMSQRMQKEAKRRAMRLKSHILAYENGGEPAVIVAEDEPNRCFVLKSGTTGEVIKKISYKVSWWRTNWVNILRTPNMLYFSGGGAQDRYKLKLASLIMVACSRLPLKYGAKLFTIIQTIDLKVAIRLRHFLKKWSINILGEQITLRMLRGRKRIREPLEEKRTAKWLWKRKEILKQGPRSDNAVFISLLVSACDEARVNAFVDAVERTAVHPERIEIIMAAKNDSIPRQKSGGKLQIRYCAPAANNDINHLLSMASAGAYFIANMNDNVIFETKGWDKELEKYIGYYPDHLFRIRCSQNRFRNYMNLEECTVAPDNITFSTRDWLSVQGDFGVLAPSEIFQQCVAFYLFSNDPFSHIQYYRDIALPHLRFSGENPVMVSNHTITRAVRREMKRRAMLLKAHILIRQMNAEQPHTNISDVEIFESSVKSVIIVKKGDKKIAILPYAIPYAILALSKKLSNFFYIKSVLSYVKDMLMMGKYTDAVHNV